MDAFPSCAVPRLSNVTGLFCLRKGDDGVEESSRDPGEIQVRQIFGCIGAAGTHRARVGSTSVVGSFNTFQELYRTYQRSLIAAFPTRANFLCLTGLMVLSGVGTA